MLEIGLLSAAQADALLPDLSALLGDAVDSGASVGFLPPLDPDTARRYWDEVLAAVAQGSRLLFVARQEGEVVGTVQLDLCRRGNGLHRAEIMKLLVHTRSRRQGVGQELMRALEAEARRAGRTTLVLDARAGDPSERLYAKLGYTRAGLVPQYARSADGTLHASAFYYRLLV